MFTEVSLLFSPTNHEKLYVIVMLKPSYIHLQLKIWNAVSLMSFFLNIDILRGTVWKL